LGGRPELEAGIPTTLGIADGDIVIREDEQVLARFPSEDSADLAKCLHDGFTYHGEVEIEDGETFVRFWMD